MTVVVILLIRRKYRGGAELGGGGAGRQISKPDLLSQPAVGEAQPDIGDQRRVCVGKLCKIGDTVPPRTKVQTRHCRCWQLDTGNNVVSRQLETLSLLSRAA